MKGLRPKLVMGENNQVCMQLKLGAWSATKALPEHLATLSEAELDEYFQTIVPEMTKELYRLRRQDARKVRKKAK